MRAKSVVMAVTLFVALVMVPLNAPAKSRATVKRQSIRAENPKIGKEWLVLPYVFSTDDMGTVFGVGFGGNIPGTP